MAQCITPFQKPNEKTGLLDSLPCGKCLECRKRRISGWSFRLTKEMQRATSAFFITLTYDIDHVPITKNNMLSLKKTDCQAWFKKLRKISTSDRIKYYLCGEYGSKTKRPHYHVIMYNVELSALIGKKRAEISQSRPEYYLDGYFMHDCPTWEHGYITIGTVTEASIGYCLVYIGKTPVVPLHKNDFRQKEFSLMSKRLGNNYLSENSKTWHKNDLENRMYVPLKDGKKIAMPRYFKEKIYSEEEKQKIVVSLLQRETDRINNLTVDQQVEEHRQKKLVIAEKIRKQQQYDQKNGKI